MYSQRFVRFKLGEKKKLFKKKLTILSQQHFQTKTIVLDLKIGRFTKLLTFDLIFYLLIKSFKF